MIKKKPVIKNGTFTRFQLWVDAPTSPEKNYSDLSKEELTTIAVTAVANFDLGSRKLLKEFALEAGRAMTVIKENRLEHGEFTKWLEEHFPKCKERARDYMRLAEWWPKIEAAGKQDETLSHLLDWIKRQNTGAGTKTAKADDTSNKKSETKVDPEASKNTAATKEPNTTAAVEEPLNQKPAEEEQDEDPSPGVRTLPIYINEDDDDWDVFFNGVADAFKIDRRNRTDVIYAAVHFAYQEKVGEKVEACVLG